MQISLASLANGVRYRDPEFDALLRGLQRGALIAQPVAMAFTGAPRPQLAGAAKEMAGMLGRTIVRADLAGAVSRYIGETEKNLDALFRRAQHSGAVLLFDEADALFGRRSDPAAGGERYANLEISYLLARLAAHRGLVVMLFVSEAEARKPRGLLRPLLVRFAPR